MCVALSFRLAVHKMLPVDVELGNVIRHLMPFLMVHYIFYTRRQKNKQWNHLNSPEARKTQGPCNVSSSYYFTQHMKEGAFVD